LNSRGEVADIERVLESVELLVICDAVSVRVKLNLERSKPVGEGVGQTGEIGDRVVIFLAFVLVDGDLLLKVADVSLARIPRISVTDRHVVVGVPVGVLLGLDSSGDSSNGCNDKSGAHDL
jgi:hypothetical protein